MGGRVWTAWWSAHQAQVPSLLRAEIERECHRLELVRQQMRTIDAQRRQELAQQPLVKQLSRLRAIGACSAWVLTKELFGWRHFDNRRQLAGSSDWYPRRTPAAIAYASKASASRATNACVGCWWSCRGAG